MMKLGETKDITKYGAATKAWLCKQPSLRKYTDKIYIVLVFYPGKGWSTAYNGTLKEARQFVKEIA